MKHLARFFLLVFAAAMFWGLAGCASSSYQKGIRHYKPDDVAAALRELKPLAEQGNAEAQFNLGSLYYQGWEVPQDYKEAVKWLRKAADQGHVFSQTTLGTVYAEGVQGVVEKDYSQALMWFIFAAARGDMEAMEFRDSLANRMTPAQIVEAQKLAREFKPQDVYTKSLQEFSALAEQGDAAAQFKVGLMYYKGQGVRPDYLESLNWFKKAALQGHPLAQFNVGYMNEKGEGTPQDYVEAVKFYRQSAEQGNQLAQHNLGYMYEKGQGVLADEVQALMWYNLAAVQGETKAKAARDRVTVWMTPAQIAESQRLAREFRIVGK
ncbi:MAG: sel1 repeat family protein [Syntrophaceae bacterium]|nr:sel1 repeat family protein [Pseudomonadota bacterium]MCG2742111.1 sel1 repeat family protein [Syntrophaceae bacterium]